MSTIVSEIRWAISPDHCDPYRRLSGPRGPEPPPPDPIPPVEPPNVDPHFFDVILLVGSESSTNIDESLYHHGDGSPDRPNAVSTTSAKFGTHSMYPPGGLILWNSSSQWNIAPTQMTEFTIEAWVYQTQRDPTFPEIIVGCSFLGISWAFMVQPGGDLRFAYQTLESGFGGHGNFTNILQPSPFTATVPLNQWTYVAVTKDAAKHFRLYINGIMVGKRTPNDATMDTPSIDLVDVGEIGLFGTNNWTGYIDELRITRHVARYRTDTSYPLPKRAWPRPPPTTTVVRSWENASQVRSDA